MGALKSFWESATTRAIAIVSVVGLFLVYIVRSWRHAGSDGSLQIKRIETIDAFSKRRVEISANSTEEINRLESELQMKLSEIDAKAQTIKADVDQSRNLLAEALNKSFGL